MYPQGFSGRSLLSSLLGSGDLTGKFTVTSPAASVSLPAPRPCWQVSSLADADHRVGSTPGSTDFELASGGEGEVSALFVGTCNVATIVYEMT